MQPDTELWDPWHPRVLADRLRGLNAPWCITAGWALDLFRGGQSRDHHDLEIAIPAGRFTTIPPLFPELDFWVPQGERILAPMTTETLTVESHQTWAWEPTTQRWRFDVFREPHDGDTWICRREQTIRMPYRQTIERTPDGIPFQKPEIVLLFKAKHTRDKDQTDFDRTLPLLTELQRAWLDDALARVHPDHIWRSGLI
jgi:hypothetical protein